MHKLETLYKEPEYYAPKSVSWESGPGTSIRKCFTPPIRFSQSSNFQADEYCRQMHLEVCEWNTSSAVQIPVGAETKIFVL